MMDEPTVMESVEAILNDPAIKHELIENLRGVYNNINSSTMQQQVQQQVPAEFMS